MVPSLNLWQFKSVYWRRSMASAIVQGLLENKHINLRRLLAPSARIQQVRPSKATGIQYFETLRRQFENEAVVLACKPSICCGRRRDRGGCFQQANLVDSGGDAALAIERGFSKAQCRRTMPNTPGQIGAGVTAAPPRALEVRSSHRRHPDSSATTTKSTKSILMQSPP